MCPSFGVKKILAFGFALSLFGQQPYSQALEASSSAPEGNYGSYVFITKPHGEIGKGYIADGKLIDTLKAKIHTDFLYFKGMKSAFILADSESIQDRKSTRLN